MSLKTTSELVKAFSGFTGKQSFIIAALIIALAYLQFVKIPSLERERRIQFNHITDTIEALDNRIKSIDAGSLRAPGNNTFEDSKSKTDREIESLKSLRDEMSRVTPKPCTKNCDLPQLERLRVPASDY